MQSPMRPHRKSCLMLLLGKNVEKAMEAVRLAWIIMYERARPMVAITHTSVFFSSKKRKNAQLSLSHECKNVSHALTKKKWHNGTRYSLSVGWYAQNRSAICIFFCIHSCSQSLKRAHRLRNHVMPKTHNGTFFQMETLFSVHPIRVEKCIRDRVARWLCAMWSAGAATSAACVPLVQLRRVSRKVLSFVFETR